MAKGTTIYLVACDDAQEHSIACATLEDARKLRADLQFPDGAITKVVIPDMPIREMLVAVYNREGFSNQYDEVVPPLPMPDRPLAQ